MVLGGSVGQLGAIHTVKNLGLKCLVIDKNPQAIGFTYADYYEVVDTTDKMRALEIARKYKISGAMTISSDIAVPTVCYINEQLGLPNQGVGIATSVTDKAYMRDCFVKKGVRAPKHLSIETEQNINQIKEMINKEFKNTPIIVKPSDSSGSRGVTRVDNLDNLEEVMQNARKYSRNNKIILEQFIEGYEIGAQCFSINGKLKYCFVHNDTVSNNLIPIGHSFPSKLKEYEIKIIENECEKALDSLGIVNGPSNVDIIMKDGKPYIIEIGARIGATKLPELVKYHTGIDLIEISILLALGKRIEIKNISNKPVAAELLYFEEESIVEDLLDIKLSIEDFREEYKMIECAINIEKGQKINALKSGIDIYGYVICTGENAIIAEENSRNCINKIKKRIKMKSIGG